MRAGRSQLLQQYTLQYTIDMLMLTSATASNTCAADVARGSPAQWPARIRLAQGAMLCVLGLLGASPAACAAQSAPLPAASAHANLNSFESAALPGSELVGGGGRTASIAHDAQQQLWVDDASSSGDQQQDLTAIGQQGCAPTVEVDPYVIKNAGAPWALCQRWVVMLQHELLG